MPVETHPPQRTFLPNDTAELRNKTRSGRCRRCDRMRREGEHFRVCSGCQSALYCGEECQKADWPAHKAICKFNQQTSQLMASSPEGQQSVIDGLPNFIELKAHLRDFTEVHKASLTGIFQAKVVLQGGAENIEPQVCIVPLKYRAPGPEGPNPALTFTCKSVALLPRARLLADAPTRHPQLFQAWEASASTRERIRAVYANDPDFVDALPVLFQPQIGPTQMVYFPQYRSDGMLRSVYPTREAAQRQIDLYLKFIELGIVVQDKNARRGMEKPAPGYMKKMAGGKWVWTVLFDWETDPAWLRAKSMAERFRLLQQKLEAAQRSAA
ncbi:hypothetical protein BV20DRAFT_963042 [Pilatotrama ljubarskyi]|nr:hypothetical protein BV20DRAFT_963042 [Pilatotrama ljubarskyi]